MTGLNGVAEMHAGSTSKSGYLGTLPGLAEEGTVRLLVSGFGHTRRGGAFRPPEFPTIYPYMCIILICHDACYHSFLNLKGFVTC